MRYRVWLALAAPLLLVAALLAAAPAVRAAPALTYTVNDGSDVDVCTGGIFPVCTLRGAIDQANLNPGSTINFDPAVTEVFLDGPLPPLTGAGTLIHGNSGLPVISGISMTVAGDMFVINAADITIEYLQLINGSSGLFQDYAHIRMVGGTRARIRASSIGAKFSSSSCFEGELVRAPNYGIVISNAVTGSGLLGQGAAYIYSNQIGCHNFYGVALFGADFVYVSFNDIGVNGYDGVILSQAGADGAQNNSLFGNTIARNLQHGISLFGDQTAGNSLSGNSIGIDPSSNTAIANGVDGVYLGSGTHDNTVGGAGASRNIISGNGSNGVELHGAGTNNIIVGNHIGTDASGSVARANAASGVLVTATNVTLITGNVISGNALEGVWVDNSSANQISANHIGVDVTGTAAIANQGRGVLLSDGASSNLVGSSVAAAAANVIAGNGGGGVAILRGGDATGSNVVAGNYIGVNIISGFNHFIANGGPGVYVLDANNNYVGLPSSTLMQYLANNFGAGVRVENSSGTTIADENTIGSLAGNYGAGVLLLNAVNSIVYPGDVSYNGGPGIAVVGAGAVHNRITPLHVGFNAGLPIDLGDDGFTPNGAHSGPGPNNWIRYPQITSFAGHVVTGTACAACTVYVYQTIANPIVSAGGDWKYLLQTVANGAGLWSATLPVTLTASNVQMVAADDSGNSSEMSGAPRPLYLPLIRR